MFLISTLLMIIAGCAKSFMDISSENGFKDNLYNKDRGDNNDENKWKQPLEPGKPVWWYGWIIYKTRYVEKYPFSSTILVIFTDWWHRFQSLFLLFFCLSIVFYTPILPIICEYSIGYIPQKWIVYIFDTTWFFSVLCISFEYLYNYIKKEKISENKQ